MISHDDIKWAIQSVGVPIVTALIAASASRFPPSPKPPQKMDDRHPQDELTQVDDHPDRSGDDSIAEQEDNETPR
jgi:hypothetical protein